MDESRHFACSNNSTHEHRSCAVKLQRAATACYKFLEDNLDDTIQDRFICGLIKQCSYPKIDLTLKRALEFVLARETADKSAKLWKDASAGACINLVSRNSLLKRELEPCYLAMVWKKEP